MALIYWPSEFPERVLRDGFSLTAPEARIRSQMSTGPGKVRRRTSSGVTPVQCAMHLTHARAARLQRFWDEDTAGGSLPFVMVDQIRHNLPLLAGGVEVLAGGEEILCPAYWLCRFAEPFQIVSFGAQFQANFTLQVLP